MFGKVVSANCSFPGVRVLHVLGGIIAVTLASWPGEVWRATNQASPACFMTPVARGWWCFCWFGHSMPMATPVRLSPKPGLVSAIVVLHSMASGLLSAANNDPHTPSSNNYDLSILLGPTAGSLHLP